MAMLEHADNAVEIVLDADTWCVLLTEGGQTARYSFELESFALSFATGQRIRLGLHSQTRSGKV